MLPSGQFNKTIIRKGPQQGIYFATKDAIYFGSPTIEPQKIADTPNTLCMHVERTRLIAGTQNGQILGPGLSLRRSGPVVKFIKGDKLYDVSAFAGEYLIQHTAEQSEAAWIVKNTHIYWDGKQLITLGKKCLADLNNKPIYHFEQQPQQVIILGKLFWRVENNALVDYFGKNQAELPPDADEVTIQDNTVYYLRGGKGLESLVLGTNTRTHLFPRYEISCFAPGVKRIHAPFT